MLFSRCRDRFKIVRAICLLLTLVVPVAWATQANAELKIAMLDPQRAVENTNEAKVMFDALEEELKAELETTNKLKDEIERLRDSLAKDEAIMSAEQKRRGQRDIREKTLRYTNTARLIQEVRNQRLEELFRELQPRLKAELEDLVELEGYDLVLTFSPQTALYVNPKHDITRRISENLNSEQ